MHDFRWCQIFHSSHFWNTDSWHCHMCNHVTLISVGHVFNILKELPYCFCFQTVSLCLINLTNNTANNQTNSTENRYYSSNISGCKVPLIYFSSIDGITLWMSVMLSVSTTSVKFINYPTSMAINCHFFRISHIFTIRTTMISQLIFQEMCEFSIPRSKKPNFPRLYHFSKCDLEEKPSPFSLNCYPQLTPSMFLWNFFTY